MRLMLGLLAGRDGRHFVLDGDASLRRRPMRRVGQPLASMGADVRGRDGGNLAPLAVQGRKLKGTVIGTPVASAQVKSALLLAALTAESPTTVIEPAQSRDHSERMLKPSVLISPLAAKWDGTSACVPAPPCRARTLWSLVTSARRPSGLWLEP